ncbi:MAG: hypothetical protein HY951_00560 [Bacteroidia bacterium]|nr:hypothetical protein [Bacteroidia bacterium]
MKFTKQKLIIYLKKVSNFCGILFFIGTISLFVLAFFLHENKLFTNDSLKKLDVYNTSIIPSLKNIADKKFIDSTELKFQIQSILEENNCLDFNDFAVTLIENKKDSNNIGYWILPINNLVPIPKNIIDNIEKIKNKPFENEEKLIISIKRLITVNAFNKYEKILNKCIVNETKTRKILSNVGLKLYLFFMLLFITAGITAILLEDKEKKQAIKREYDTAAKELEKNPDTNSELNYARKRLDKYFDDNQSNLKYIFWISIILIISGFLMLVIVFILYFKIPDSNLTLPGSFFGIILEFIGTIFLFVYKSTIQQALKNTSTLENISNVSLAIKILNEIVETENNKSEITNAKIEISKLLISNRNIK